MIGSDPAYTVDRMSKATGITPRVLAKRRSEKKGPQYIKFGGRIYYRQSIIAAWTQANMEKQWRTKKAETMSSQPFL